MKANKFFEVFRKSKPFGHIPNTFDGDCLMTCGNAFEFAEAYAKHEMINFLDDLRNYLHESHNDLLKDERTSKEFVEIYLNP